MNIFFYWIFKTKCYGLNSVPPKYMSYSQLPGLQNVT